MSLLLRYPPVLGNKSAFRVLSVPLHSRLETATEGNN